MGAWAEGLFDNDQSCNVRDSFFDLMKEAPNTWSAVGLLHHRYKQETDDVDVVMALAYLEIGFATLTHVTKEMTVQAIEKELTELHRWKNPDKRRTMLEGFRAFLLSCECVEEES